MEFAELRKALRTMADELSEARRLEVESARLRAWTEMARRVAHELKNPLTPMRMAATTLARSADPWAEESAEVLLEEIGRLDEMARSFSQFGRLPEGPRSEVDLVELADGLAARHGDVGVPVEVRADGEVPTVMGYYEVLSRAVRNLVVNAVEASSDPSDLRGGTVAHGDESPGAPSPVEITVTREDETVRLAVRDRGAGIPPGLLNSIWMPDVTTKTEGTGLGLAMVRQAAEAHGGHVFAANREGGGAEIGFVVPVRDTTTDSAQPGHP